MLFKVVEGVAGCALPLLGEVEARLQVFSAEAGPIARTDTTALHLLQRAAHGGRAALEVVVVHHHVRDLASRQVALGAHRLEHSFLVLLRDDGLVRRRLVHLGV